MDAAVIPFPSATRRLVPTRLLAGDELGPYKKADGSIHRPAEGHDLSALYGVNAKAIVVDFNNVTFTTEAIDAWVAATGGDTLPNGQIVFGPNSVIMLPEGGPREAVPGAVVKVRSNINPWGLAMIAGGLLLRRPLLMVGGAAVAFRLLPGTR